MVWLDYSIIRIQIGAEFGPLVLVFTMMALDVGRTAPFASPIRFESLGLLHDPYTLPEGNLIDP